MPGRAADPKERRWIGGRIRASQTLNKTESILSRHLGCYRDTGHLGGNTHQWKQLNGRDAAQRDCCSNVLKYTLLGILACAKSCQSCPTVRNPMDCSPPSSSVHGILQARILEWVAMPFSKVPSLNEYKTFKDIKKKCTATEKQLKRPTDGRLSD